MAAASGASDLELTQLRWAIDASLRAAEKQAETGTQPGPSGTSAGREAAEVAAAGGGGDGGRAANPKHWGVDGGVDEVEAAHSPNPNPNPNEVEAAQSLWLAESLAASAKDAQRASTVPRMPRASANACPAHQP